MAIILRPMTIHEYEQIRSLWEESEGIGLSHADTRENIARYLQRNPGLSLTAWEGEKVVGAMLCGHDGRRGYIHHLAVSKAYQRKGIGRSLVTKGLDSLKEMGIAKCHIFVYASNHQAISFWKNNGWEKRTELILMSKPIQG